MKWTCWTLGYVNGLVYGASRHLQQYLSYIVAVSFIGGEGNVVPWENDRPVASQRQTLSHYTVSSTPRHERGSNLDIDYIVSCKSEYHTIMTTTTPS